jgi:8-oxo-dGTP diphosphatase
MPDPSDNGSSTEPPLVLVAAAALIDGTGRVLLTQRPAGKALAGAWEFPGGKVEVGETPEAALVRELKEELAIDVKTSSLEPFTFASHAYQELHLLMPLYLCRTWEGVPVPMEGQALNWVRPLEMRGLQMPQADVPLVERLIRWSL